jgi:cell division protein FtsL
MVALQPATRRARALEGPLAPAAPRLGPRVGGAARRVSGLFVLGLTLLAVATLGILQVLQTSHVAAIGYELRTLERERSTLAAEVRLLEAEAARGSNLDRLYTEAVERLGMVPPEQRLHVSVQESAPRTVPLPRRYVGQVEAPAPRVEPAWWERVLAVLPGLD